MDEQTDKLTDVQNQLLNRFMHVRGLINFDLMWEIEPKVAVNVLS